VSFETLAYHLNELKKKGIVSDYAIGGGVAAYEYTSLPTKDVDVFVIFSSPSRDLILMTPIYDYFTGLGCKWSKQWLMFEGYPVEFIPADTGLEREAVENAVEKTYHNILVRMLSPEYLIAVSVNVGRDRDFLRVNAIMSNTVVDERLLEEILAKYGSINRFRRYRSLYGRL
jgi:hypothetical protein